MFTHTGTSPALIQIKDSFMSKTVQVLGIDHALQYIVPLDVFKAIPRQSTVEDLDAIVQHRRIYHIPIRIIDDDNRVEGVRVGNIGRLEESRDTISVFLRQFNKVKKYITQQKYDSQEDVEAVYAEVKHMLNEIPTLMDQAHNRLTRQGAEWLRDQKIMMDRPRGKSTPEAPTHLSGDLGDDLYSGGRKRTRNRKRKRKTRKSWHSG